MDTPSPNLGLRRFTGADDWNHEDVNFNSDTIDTAVALTICTSGTRPASLLFNGRRIYETDTDKILVYKNGSWVEERDLSPAVYACRANQLSAAQSFANSTYIDVVLDDDDFDTTGDMHSTTVNNTRIYARADGLYEAVGNVTFAANTSGMRKASINQSGSVSRSVALDSHAVSSPGTGSINLSTGPFEMQNGDYIALNAMQSSGSTLALDNSVGSTFLSLRRVGDLP